MNYLLDAALFLLVGLGLTLAGFCLWAPSRSSFEASFVPGAAVLGVWGGLVWVSGSVRLLPSFWALLPIPLLLGLIVWKRSNLLVHAKRCFVGLKSLKWDERVWAGYLVFLFAFTFVLSLVPPSGSDYDSLMYHLAVPAQYLRAGKIVQLTYDHHSYFPSTLEMLYTLGLAMRDAVFAKLFHWIMLPIGAFALLAIGKRAHSAKAGLIAACLYASMPMVLQEATSAYIDLGFAAFAFLAVLCFCDAPTKDNNANWLWSGAFCGLCMGTKYFGALFLGFLGITLLVRVLRPNSRESSETLKPNWRTVAVFTVPALVLGLPWYIRNAVWTGNPVFPFAYSVFGGTGWTAQMAKDYDVSQAIYGFGKSLPDLILLPWRVAMTPISFGQPFFPFIPGNATPPQTGIFEVQGLFAEIFPGPAIFALGIPALFLKGKPREITLCVWLFAFLWFFWVFTSQQIRYLLPALGLLALIAGWGVAVLSPRLRIARTVGGLLLILWLTCAPATVAMRSKSTWPVITGAVSNEDYLRRTFPGYDVMSYANQNTPKEAKFAVYGEPRCFYLDRAYFWADDQHNNLIDYTKLKDGAALVLSLKALGATYVLVNADVAHTGGAFEAPTIVNAAIEHGNLILIYQARGYQLYRVANS